MKTALLTLFILCSFTLHAQIREPKAYYKPLVKQLSKPDSLYIYEVNSNRGSGIAFFVAFKNSQSICGYWLNKNFTQRQLMPRNLLPKDSLSGFERLITDGTIVPDSLLSFIRSNDILHLSTDDNNGCKIKDNIDDESYFNIVRVTGDTVLAKSEYAIYSYGDQCPQMRSYQLLQVTDKLFGFYFPKYEMIITALLNEYRSRRTAETDN